MVTILEQSCDGVEDDDGEDGDDDAARRKRSALAPCGTESECEKPTDQLQALSADTTGFMVGSDEAGARLDSMMQDQRTGGSCVERCGLAGESLVRC